MSSVSAAGPAATRVCFGLFPGTSSPTISSEHFTTHFDYLHLAALLFFACQFIAGPLMDALSDSSLFNRYGDFKHSHRANNLKNVI